MSLYGFLTRFFKPFFSLLYPTKVIGRENIPDGKVIVVCNHYSSTDIIVLATRVFPKKMNYLAKKELFKKRFNAKFLSKMGGIPIDRDTVDVNAMKKILQVLSDDEKLLIFPEGTRNKAGTPELLPLKDGASLFAIKTKTPILPMIFLKKPRLFRKNYIFIGEPFTLEEFYGTKEFKEATNLIQQEMDDCRGKLYKTFPKSIKLLK